jgi:hypothetical protein
MNSLIKNVRLLNTCAQIIVLFLLILNANTFCQTSENIRDETNKFLNTLNKDELQLTSLSFKDSLRTHWTNFPIGLAKRPGIRYGVLSEESKIQFHHLLTAILSSQGYLKTISIMNLDDILNLMYGTLYENNLISDENYEEIRSINFGYNNYFISVWGEPNKIEPWGLKFEGHHLSINLSVIGNNYSLTPLFIGTDPAELTITKYAGLRVLSKEEDYGLLLINSLSEEQKANATLSQEVPGDIITNPQNTQRIMDYQGIKATDLVPEQKNILEILIKEYINNLEHDKAHEYLEKIKKSGIDQVYFAWIGSYEIRKPNYYIINGPDFIIEYDNNGFQKNGNHIHSIWREKGNDFGEDILKTHYLKHKH